MIEIKDNGTKECEVNKKEEDPPLLQPDSIAVDTRHDIALEHDSTSEGNGNKECEVKKQEEDPNLLQHDSIAVDTNHALVSEQVSASEGTFSRSHNNYIKLQNIKSGISQQALIGSS